MKTINQGPSPSRSGRMAPLVYTFPQRPDHYRRGVPAFHQVVLLLVTRGLHAPRSFLYSSVLFSTTRPKPPKVCGRMEATARQLKSFSCSFSILSILILATFPFLAASSISLSSLPYPPSSLESVIAYSARFPSLFHRLASTTNQLPLEPWTDITSQPTVVPHPRRMGRHAF